MSPTSYQAAPPRAIDTTRLAPLLQPLARRAGALPDATPQIIGDLWDLCNRTKILARRAGALPDATPQIIGDLWDLCNRTKILARRATGPLPRALRYMRDLPPLCNSTRFTCPFSAQNSGTLTLELLHVLARRSVPFRTLGGGWTP